MPKEATEAVSVGVKDILVVGPGVLGRLVAQKWTEVGFCDSFSAFVAISFLELVLATRPSPTRQSLDKQGQKPTMRN